MNRYVAILMNPVYKTPLYVLGSRNINLKLNSKLMGTNLVLHPDSRPRILNEPVSFFLFASIAYYTLWENTQV